MNKHVRGYRPNPNGSRDIRAVGGGADYTRQLKPAYKQSRPPMIKPETQGSILTILHKEILGPRRAGARARMVARAIKS